MSHYVDRQPGWKNEKFMTKSPHGNLISSGGILFYDDGGLWLIKEKVKDKVIYSDFGGKYKPEDADIYRTIARELAEESYNILDLRRSDIIDFFARYEWLYAEEKEKNYPCVIVHVKELDVKLEDINIRSVRNRILSNNPLTVEEIYSTIDLEHIEWAQMKPETPLWTTLNQRVKNVWHRCITFGIHK